ncbi:MAG: class I poly(R)-hydroxyalkanoic acid synthase [Alphaproteobacteria bacterium]|nr:class I poly(R)-hydroxyalkanoic acid synthase [Alphaproteobacteria bacterium]
MEKMPDPLALSQALSSAYQRSQPTLMEIMERYKTLNAATSGQTLELDPMNLREASADLMGAMAANPVKYWAIQIEHVSKQAALWQSSLKKFRGEEVEPVIKPEKGDRRFKGKDWDESVLFDFIKQYYLLACDFVNESIETTEGISPQSKAKLSFAAKLFMEALSPSNFIMTNPEVLHETIKTGGENLVKGLQNFNEDLARGHGELKISTTDYESFRFGENIAATPGSVVYENELMQLIQYKPATQKVFRRPLLIIPPWINKYYILDLKPKGSFIEWAVEQGHTVFCISWVNPDAKLAQKQFEDYMAQGVIAAMDTIEDITGEPDCNAIGYCLGGTLLTATMAALAEKKQSSRIASATFFTTLIDFEEAGEMKLFMDEGQIEALEKSMSVKGVLDAKELQRTFSLLRANDMIWAFVINNYLMGKEPFPFDLLYWNDDSTNMPAAMHTYYLKNMYRDNLLAVPGGLKMNGVPIDVHKIKTPCYFLSTKEDHIAPWKATYKTTQMVSGPKTFTLAASGHIAGVVNPPGKNKYCYWSAQDTPEKPEDWLESAKETHGSWWPHWQKWTNAYTREKIPARDIKKSIEPAPGRYVKVKNP